MKATALLVFAALHFVTAPAAAQSARQAMTIGTLAHGTRDRPEFYQGLRELGYKEGQNIHFEKRSGLGNAERLATMAADLANRKVALIVAVGPLAVGAAMKATTTIPIVMLGGSDPIRRGFVKSLTAPDGNVTGLSGSTNGAGGKRMELFKESFPSIRSVAILAPRTRPGVPEAFIHAARSMGFDLQIVPLATEMELEASLAKVKALRPDALIAWDEVSILRHTPEIVDFAIANRLPSIFETSRWVRAGGLMSYGPNQQMQARRAAVFVDKILKGAKPADLPVEPAPMEFVVNLVTAKKLGVKIPPQILLEADEVIK